MSLDLKDAKVVVEAASLECEALLSEISCRTGEAEGKQADAIAKEASLSVRTPTKLSKREKQLGHHDAGPLLLPCFMMQQRVECKMTWQKESTRTTCQPIFLP